MRRVRLSIKQRAHLDWSLEQAQKGGFDTFMLKEIHEQPEMLRRMLERHLPSPDEPVDLPGFAEFMNAQRVSLFSLVGCGTAYHACKVGKYVLEGLARIPVPVEYAHEAQYHQAPLSPHAVTVAVSQSGETADTLGAVRAQQEAGSRVIVCLQRRRQQLDAHVRPDAADNGRPGDQRRQHQGLHLPAGDAVPDGAVDRRARRHASPRMSCGG